MTIVPKSKSGYKKIKWLFGKEIRIPNEWKVKKLNELGDIITGSTPPTSIPEHYGDDYLWASPTDLENTKFIKNTQSKLSNKGFNISRAIPKNSILVVCIASIGKIGIASKTMTSNQQINSIVCNLEHPEFVYYSLLKNNTLIKNMANRTVVPILNKTDFGTIRITLPCNYDEQQKIASILSGVDANIEATQKVIDKTEKLKRGLMQRLLTKGIGHTKFKKINWFFGKEIEIPKEWDIKQVKEVFEFLKTGTNARKDLSKCGNVRYIHYGDIHQKWHLVLDCNSAEIPFIAKKNIKNLSLLQNGDLVIADASEDHEGSGASILIKNVGDKEIVSGLHTFALRDNNDSTDSEFRTYITSIKTVKTQIIAYVTGISVYGLSKTNFKIIKIPIPSFAEQTKIASILSGVDAIGITLLFRFQVCLRMMVARCMLVLCL